MSSSTKLVLYGTHTRVMDLNFDCASSQLKKPLVRIAALIEAPFSTSSSNFSDCFIAATRPPTTRTKTSLQSISSQAGLETKMLEAD